MADPNGIDPPVPRVPPGPGADPAIPADLHASHAPPAPHAEDSEQRFRATFEQAAVGMAHVAPDGRWLRVNPRLCEILGYDCAELMRLTFQDLTHPDDVDANLAHVRRLLAGEAERYSMQKRYVRRDGSVFWAHLTASLVRGADGRPAYFISVIEDIDDLKRAYEANDRLAAMVQASREAIFSVDLEGVVRTWNPASERLFGFRADQIVGRPVAVLAPPDRRDEPARLLAAVRAGEAVTELETVRVRRDGSGVDVLLTLGPVFDREGRVVGGAATVRDVTDRRRAEARLVRDSMLLANVRDSVIVTDLAGVTTFWNEGATRLFGFEAAEMIGRPYAERLPEPSRADVARWIERVAAGDEFNGEWLDWRRDGSRVWIQAQTRRITDAGGNVVGIMGVSHDISGRKRAEAELREAREVAEAAREAAEAASRAKDQFLAVLSHELRTPLTPVLTTVQMMESDPALPAEVRERMTMIRRNVELEARLIDDMLDLTRVSRGKLELQFVPTDLHEKVRQVLAICDSDIRSRQLRIELSLSAGRHRVRADPARIQQVLWNVLKNATKFTPAGGRVAIGSRDTPDGRLAVSVTDTGVGIAAEALPRIFDAFDQGGQQVTRLFGGLGLGLAISKALVDMHGGTLTAESEGAGRGATFTLMLPALPASADRGDPGPGSAGDGASAVGGRRILLVEDHGDTSRALSALLRRGGHEVRTAASVAAALLTAEAEPFDLMISDIGLPDGSGLDLMSQLRARRLPQPLRGIALSGYGMEQDIRRSREAGFDAHLTKPVDIRKLEEAIRGVLGKAGENPGAVG